MLKTCGINTDIQVDFCYNGYEAFQMVQDIYNSGLSYKLIMTDFNMPIMDGIKATYKIRDFLTNTRHIERDMQPRIIGITGHVHD